MKRQEVLKQWENWKNQMAYQKTHGDTDGEGPQQQGAKSKAYQELIGKIESELEQKSSSQAKARSPEMQFEKTFAEEIRSNVCPICLELMIPPKNKPMILFPCGHTFCVSCIDISEKTTGCKKCSLCKKVYSQKAVNISLQNLICIFTDNNHLLEAALPDPAADLSESPNEQQSHYKQKLALLESRLSLLGRETADVKGQIEGYRLSVHDSQKLNKLFYDELVLAKDKLQKAQMEVELVESHIKSSSERLAGTQTKLTEAIEKLHLIEETVKGLEQERVKTVVLLNASQE